MMGPRQVAQRALFYEFSIEDHVPPDHLLRGIDRFVDLGDLRRHLVPFYSSTGRPSVDPELMIRMLIVGYAMGIRSERRLCEEVHLNLAYRWFCRLDLTDPVPDHSTFSKNRHGRFRDSNLFRRLFEEVLAHCIDAGLVGGENFGADASLIKADASRYTKVDFTEWSATDVANRATQEYLDTLDDTAFGAATPVKPKAISPADPAARLTGANGDRPFFAYSTNYLVDLDNAVILDVEATAPIRQAEVGAVRDMLARTGASSACTQAYWPRTRRMAPPTCWAGLLRSKTSNRTFRSSTNPSARTVRSRRRTSRTIPTPTPTNALGDGS